MWDGREQEGKWKVRGVGGEGWDRRVGGKVGG